MDNGFVLPNKKSNLPLSSYAISVNLGVHVTGIDVFQDLEDEVKSPPYMLSLRGSKYRNPEILKARFFLGRD